MGCPRLTCLLFACSLAACGGDEGIDPVGDVPSALINPIKVWAFSATDVWFLDGGPTVHRFDGSTWSTLATPSTGGLACIYALSASDVWLCAGDEVLHYDGSTFTASDVTATTGLDSLSAIWATGTNDVWAVGDDAIVAHYNGTAWSRTIVGSPFKSSIWGSGPSDIYALSTFDLMHYDGNTWTEVELDGSPAGGDGQIWGLSASDVWLMNGDDRIWHYDGSSWEGTEESTFDYSAVWGTGPRNVYAGGSPGVVAHYTGSWKALAHQDIGAPYLQQMLSVHGSSANDVWVVGRQLGEGGSTPLIYHIQ